MKRLKRSLFFWSLVLPSFGWAVVPTQPSVVTVQGTQLIVQKRLSDGTLSSTVTYTIKGVDWSPATSAPATGLDPTTGATVPYGFFFDDQPGNRWRSPGLEGHDLMNIWLQSQHQAYYLQDIPLMAKMHVNTVRLYTDFGTDPSVYGPILDAFYNNDIMVIMTVVNSSNDITNQHYIQVMNMCQNHPAILMWALGNEWNLNLFYGYPDIATAASALNAIVPLMKTRDPNHPISSSLGEPGSSAGIASIVNAVPNIDIWAFNLYRGANFGTAPNDIFTQWMNAGSTKPFYMGEFGIDSFNTTDYTMPYPMGPFGPVSVGSDALVSAGSEDQATQSIWDLGLWSLIQAKLSSLNSANPCLGGFVFSWNDALWKVGNYNENLGGLTNENGTNYMVQDLSGFFIPQGFPDGVSNEEYFGIVNANRIPKQAYLDLQAYYSTLAPLPFASITISPPSATLHYNQLQTFVAQGLDTFQEPLFPQPTFTWSVSPSTGVSIDQSGVFTSFVTSGTYVVTAASGMIASSITVTVAALSPPASLPFAALRVYPSPWRSDKDMGYPITFDGLTGNVTIKIFTVSGHWVQNLGPGAGSIPWNLKNSSGDLVASGLYFYLITNDQGDQARGKFAIIR